jgi:RNA polymerase sigma factor (sigma-70 family)
MSETWLQEQRVVGADAAPERLLRLLDPNPARASERYDRIFQKLVRFFATQFCTDPEDLAGETIIRACRAVSAGLELTCQFETFLFGVAKNIALEDYRRRQKADLPLEELAPGKEPCVDPPDNALDLPKWKQDLYHECLELCLRTLDEDQRALLMQFYCGSQEGETKSNRKGMAIRLGTNTRALSSRMLRLRGKLDLCIKACAEKRRRSESQDLP